MRMKITMRGVRGSIPVPGPDTVVYGGNTTCHQIETDGGDLIIIDGRDRLNCLKQAIEALTHNGVIIFDDTQRSKYSQAYEYSKRKGFRSLNFEGLKPTGFEIERTTILYREKNCLGI